MAFRVIDASQGVVYRELPGIPTPRLIEAGRGEAYFVENEDERSRERIPGVWYLRVDAEGYVAKDGKYQKVIIEHYDPWEGLPY